MSLDLTEPGQVTGERAAAPVGRRTVSWWAVAGLAIVMAYADGFWLTSLQGAIGSTERSQGPFVSWLRICTLTVPVFALAVLAALRLARRWFGPSTSRPRTVIATVLLIVAAGTVVGIAEVAANSVYDYHLQSEELRVTQGSHIHTAGAGILSQTDPQQQDAPCSGICREAQLRTLAIHVRAVGYASGVILVTNLVLAGWLVAMRGGRLDSRGIRRRRTAPDRE